MVNSNEPTVKYYDIVYSKYRPEELTQAELAMITSLVKPRAKILDTGCGTGRHLIPLAEAGYKMTGIDESAAMLEQLVFKSFFSGASAGIINDSLLTYNFEQTKFDLVISFWNAWNEMALNQESGLKILQKLKSLLSLDGKILLNISDPTTFNPSEVDFHDEITDGSTKYVVDYETAKYDPKTNITISNETIIVSEGGKVVEKLNAKITQKWWHKSELEKIASQVGLGYTYLSTKYNEELYIVLTATD